MSNIAAELDMRAVSAPDVGHRLKTGTGPKEGQEEVFYVAASDFCAIFLKDEEELRDFESGYLATALLCIPIALGLVCMLILIA